MSWLRMALVRLLNVFRARRGDVRIDAEIAAHLELLADDFQRRGMTAAEARLAARREFGGVTQVREEWRRAQGLPFAETLARDVAYALRQLRRGPGFAAAAILTLALGIGANTAIYQTLYAVVFRPLPVKDPQQLFQLELRQGGKSLGFSYPLFREMMERQKVLDGVFAASEIPLREATLRGRGSAKPIHGALVTGDYFRVLGVGARVGRVFTAEEDRKTAPVAVISNPFWTSEFDRNPAALGQNLDINGAVVTIIGVAPEGFFGETLGQAPDVWLPMSLQPQLTPTNYLNAPFYAWLSVLGRVPPDVTVRHAQAALDALYRQYADLSLRLTGPPAQFELHPATQGINQLRQFADPLYVLMAISGLVLLIASSNLANLLLSRAAARTHEIGVRLAMGAGRGCLIRQLITESLVLSTMGGALALVLARWGSRALVVLSGQPVPVETGWTVVAFTAAVAVGVTCLFGIAPALAATRVDVRTALQVSRRTQSGGRQMVARTLVVTQISVSLLLLSSAGMLVRTLWNLRHQDFGFEPDKVLKVGLPLEVGRSTWDRAIALRDPLYERMNSLPGVRVAALSSFGPLGSFQHSGPFSAAGRPTQESDASRFVHVSPRYFETMVQIVAGRGVTAEDRRGGAPVAVLSETAARKLFGVENPVGRFISNAKQFDDRQRLLVIGVAHDVHYTPRDPYGFIVYVPLAQNPAPITEIVLRVSGDPSRLAAAVRKAIQTVDPHVRIGEIRLLRDVINAGLRQETMMAWLSACFAALAALLSFVGVYGVIRYGVERRTQEIGVRLALGAQRGQVAGLIMRDFGLLLGAGLLLGSACSIAASHTLTDLLFGIGRIDWILLVAALWIIAVSGVAAYLPARRAAHLDPTEALRLE